MNNREWLKLFLVKQLSVKKSVTVSIYMYFVKILFCTFAIIKEPSSRIKNKRKVLPYVPLLPLYPRRCVAPQPPTQRPGQVLPR